MSPSFIILASPPPPAAKTTLHKRYSLLTKFMIQRNTTLKSSSLLRSVINCHHGIGVQSCCYSRARRISQLFIYLLRAANFRVRVRRVDLLLSASVSILWHHYLKLTPQAIEMTEHKICFTASCRMSGKFTYRCCIKPIWQRPKKANSCFSNYMIFNRGQI